jgi:hypothetical protein
VCKNLRRRPCADRMCHRHLWDISLHGPSDIPGQKLICSSQTSAVPEGFCGTFDYWAPEMVQARSSPAVHTLLILGVSCSLGPVTACHGNDKFEGWSTTCICFSRPPQQVDPGPPVRPQSSLPGNFRGGQMADWREVADLFWGSGGQMP